MVTAPVVLVLEAGNAVVEGDFAGQSALRQQLQRAIDGCKADARVFLLHQPVQFVGGKMIAGLEEGLQNGVTLCGLFEAYLFEVLMQDLLRFADHLTRDAGLVVNALLQHGCLADPQAWPGATGKLNDTGLWEMPPTGFGRRFVFLRCEDLESGIHGYRRPDRISCPYPAIPRHCVGVGRYGSARVGYPGLALF